MYVSELVSKSFFDRIIAEYQELYDAFELHPSTLSQEMKRSVRQKIEMVSAMKAGSSAALDPKLQRSLKLELRTAQRAWTRHLVTAARLNRQRQARRVRFLATETPVAAA